MGCNKTLVPPAKKVNRISHSHQLFFFFFGKCTPSGVAWGPTGRATPDHITACGRPANNFKLVSMDVAGQELVCGLEGGNLARPSHSWEQLLATPGVLGQAPPCNVLALGTLQYPKSEVFVLCPGMLATGVGLA